MSDLMNKSAVSRASGGDAETVVATYLEKTPGIKKVAEFTLAQGEQLPGAPGGVHLGGLPLK